MRHVLASTLGMRTGRSSTQWGCFKGGRDEIAGFLVPKSDLQLTIGTIMTLFSSHRSHRGPLLGRPEGIFRPSPLSKTPLRDGYPAIFIPAKRVRRKLLLEHFEDDVVTFPHFVLQVLDFCTQAADMVVLLVQ